MPAVGVLGGGVAALSARSLPSSALDVGLALGAPAPGGDREAHRLQRAVEVAVELAEVGDPRVGREVRLQADHPVQRAGRAP